MEPKVSVIVPVYNTEKYLPACLDSLLAQTYRNIEIICVDDCSPDKSAKILEKYVRKHSNIKVLHHEKNKGLFAARVTGLKAMTGDYFAFCDSDDTVTLDYYRAMISRAEKNGCDIVASDFVEVRNDGTYYPNRQLQQCDFVLNGDEVLDALMRSEGLDYSWSVLWNKIYSKKLLNGTLEFLCEKATDFNFSKGCDVCISAVLFSKANHFENIHGEFYRKNSSQRNVSFGNTNLKDSKMSFVILEEFLKKKKLLKKYSGNMERWKALYCDIKFKKDNAELCSFFGSHYVRISGFPLQEIKSAIASEKCKCVSFDIFDTLLLRPFWNPTDLFTYMEVEVTRITGSVTNFEFKQIRTLAERLARDKKLKIQNTREVTLDEIYACMGELCAALKSFLEKIKNLELETELRFVQPRAYVAELIEYSKYLGKKVVCASDMYLPKSFMERLLEKCGVTGLDEIFVSCEYSASKIDGTLFKIIEKKLELSPNEIVHIGDDFASDVRMSRKAGWKAFYIPKTSDCLKNRVRKRWYGGSLHKTYFESRNGARQTSVLVEKCFGTRCMLALQANRIFETPFTPVHKKSDFNANPAWFGYFALGPFLLAFATFIAEIVVAKKYDQVNFIARDGFLPMEAFKIVSAVKRINTKTNYIYTSRKAVAMMWLANKNTLYSFLPPNYFPENHSPKDFIELLTPVIPKRKIANVKQKIEVAGFDFEKPFLTIEKFCKFSNLFIEKFYDENFAKDFIAQVGEYYKKDFVGRTLVVDAGYSLRFESTLKKLFGFEIDACYVNTNVDQAYFRSQESGVNIFSLYDYFPSVSGGIREIMVSKLAPSCTGFEIKNGKVVPVFEEFRHNPASDYVIETLQNSALQFVEDFCRTFGKDYDKLGWKKQDACLALETFLCCGADYDRNIFSVFPFENDMRSDLSLMDDWNRTCFAINSMKNNFKNKYIRAALGFPQKAKKGIAFCRKNGLRKTARKTYTAIKRFAMC